MTRRRVAILISGSGSNMEALVGSMAAADHPGEPVVVISNRPEARGLERARGLGVPSSLLDHREFGNDREAFEARLVDVLAAHSPDIICLAGFMRILGAGFVRHYAGRILNIHPSLLPLFPGLNTHERALAAGMAVHGASVHLVTEELDAGPILGQAVIPVLAADTPKTLAARLLPLEHRLYVETLRGFAAGSREKIALFG